MCQDLKHTNTRLEEIEEGGCAHVFWTHEHEIKTNRWRGCWLFEAHEHEIKMNTRGECWLYKDTNTRGEYWVFITHEHKIKTNAKGGHWVFETHEHKITMNKKRRLLKHMSTRSWWTQEEGF